MSLPVEPCLPLETEPFQFQPRRKSSLFNLGILLAILALGIFIYFSPVKAWLSQTDLIKSRLAEFGYIAPLVFLLGSALLTALGVPRTVSFSLGGFVFGFGMGLVWSQIGTLLGSYATFLLVRWRGKDYSLAQFQRFQGFARDIETRGLISVILIRQLPISGFYNSVFLALTPVSHANFLLGSLLGVLPLGITATLLGAGLIQGDWTQGLQYLGMAVACSLMLGYGLNRWIRGSRLTTKLGAE